MDNEIGIGKSDAVDGASAVRPSSDRPQAPGDLGAESARDDKRPINAIGARDVVLVEVERGVLERLAESIPGSTPGHTTEIERRMQRWLMDVRSGIRVYGLRTAAVAQLLSFEGRISQEGNLVDNMLAGGGASIEYVRKHSGQI